MADTTTPYDEELSGDIESPDYDAPDRQDVDDVETLKRRDHDPDIVKEIQDDRAERLRAGALLRLQEENERQAMRDNPELFAQRELARRTLCRTNFLPFVMRFNPDYNPGWVHKDICRRLEKFSEAVANRESPRLLLTMPPRHGKSTLTTKNFPSWHLGKFPLHEIMCCSYSGSLSMSFSRLNRTLLRDPAYQSLFDARLDPDSQSAEAWLTTDGGGYVSAGIGGAITGKGAHVLVIDDPVKNREDAESETSRQNAWDWYTSTAYTRLAPGGGVLLILTRWHDDDLAGRLLGAMKEGADQWEIVNYPAIALEDEPFRNAGEALHPARYDEAALSRIEKTLGPRDWSALYMQNPVPDEGGYFKRTEFVFYDYYDPDALPPEDELVEYSCWDLAVGEKQQNDFSVNVTASIDQSLDLWVREVERLKIDSEQLVYAILNSHKKWKPQRTGIEKGVIEMSIGPFLKRIQRQRSQWDFNWTEMRPGKQDKVARARTIQGMCQAGKVHIPYNAPWSEAFITELLRFPNGLHDDQVDAFAYLGMMLMLMAPAYIPTNKAPSWRDKLGQYVAGAKSKRSAMSA